MKRTITGTFFSDTVASDNNNLFSMFDRVSATSDASKFWNPLDTKSMQYKCIVYTDNIFF